MAITIREISPSEKAAFYDLAENCDSIFCSKPFTESFGNSLLYFGLFGSSNELIGGFVALKTKLKAVSAIIDPSYAPHCGLFIVLSTESGFKKSQRIKDIMEGITSCLQSRSEKIISLSFPPEFQDFQNALWKGFEVRLKYTYRLSLTAGIGEIISSYDPKLKSSLQKFIQGEIKVDSEVSPDEVFDMISKLQKERNLRKKSGYLHSIVRNFLSTHSENSIACKLIHDSEIANVTLCIHGKSTCYYALGAINKNVKAKNAGAICLHHSITQAHLKGLKVFDFEGSSIPAIESFFRSFGGTLTPLYTVRKCPQILKRFLK
jgi:hypothetical protein